MSQIPLPQELEKVRESARRAILPIKPTSTVSHAARDILFTAKRTNASRDLPPYYLVYFLLVDLLGFQNLGRFEKLDWSIPVDLDGVVYLIEYRKSGLGVFAGDTPNSEQQARRIVALLKKATKAANPFFKWTADRAIRDSKINIRNVARQLYERYLYFAGLFVEKSIETQARKREHEIEQDQRELDIAAYSVKARDQRSPSELVAMFDVPWARLAQDSNWLALAAVDSFFAWTEHIFIHLAILQGRVITGEEVVQLAQSDWGAKFKRALDINDTTLKRYFDELIVVRRQLRNFVAHGSFGKEGEAFSFHSSAGAVPVVLDHKPSRFRLSLTPEIAFDNQQALLTIEKFISCLWSGQREPAKLYIQESDLPLILPMASDGSYAAAMVSVEGMKALVDRVMKQADAAANMDWQFIDS
jgi:hypothetical protein